MTTANIHLTIKGTLQLHHLQPGDTIIATLEQHHPPHYLEALEAHLQEAFPHNQCIIVTPGVHLEIKPA